MTVGPIQPQNPWGGRPTPEDGARTFIAALEAAQPRGQLGCAMKQAEQSIAGSVLRLCASPAVAPRQAAAMADVLTDMAKAGYNLPRLASAGGQLREVLAELAEAGTLETGAQFAALQADQDIEKLASLNAALPPLRDQHGPDELTGQVAQLVSDMSGPPWRRPGQPRSEVSAILQGMVGQLYALVASRTGPAMPGSSRDALAAVVAEVSAAVQRVEPRLSAPDRIVEALVALPRSVLLRPNGRGELLDSIQSLSNDALLLHDALVNEWRGRP